MTAPIQPSANFGKGQIGVHGINSELKQLLDNYYTVLGELQAATPIPEAACVMGSNNADTTTTGPPVLIEGAGSTEQMQYTPIAVHTGGKFLVKLTCQCDAPSGAETIELSLWHNGVLIPKAVIQRKIGVAGDIGSVSVQGIATVAGGQSIQGRQKSVGGSQVRCTYRQMSITPISDITPP
jgi:hypothetical protein